MNNNWKKIWNEKKVSKLDDLSVFETFKELKRADGFDVVVEDEEHYYKCFFNEWHSIYENAMLLSKDIESVYEVGCGSGVNLFMFSNKDIRKLGGIDYSSSLINDAKNIIDSDDVTCGNASSISTERKYDLVMSESVFSIFFGPRLCRNCFT